MSTQVDWPWEEVSVTLPTLLPSGPFWPILELPFIPTHLMLQKTQRPHVLLEVDHPSSQTFLV